MAKRRSEPVAEPQHYDQIVPDYEPLMASRAGHW